MGRRPGIPSLLRDHRRTRLDLARGPGSEAPVALIADRATAWSPQLLGEAASGWMSDQRDDASPASVGVSVLGFGRYAGWSLKQLATQDRDYLEWLLRSSGGRQYHAEIEALLQSA